jgi:hypothetical protein
LSHTVLSPSPQIQPTNERKKAKKGKDTEAKKQTRRAKQKARREMN